MDSVKIPTYWSCYDNGPGRAAERSLTAKAKTALRKVEAKAESRPGGVTHAEVRAALQAFVTGWARMDQAKTYAMSGVSDTEPRGLVADFCESVWRAYIDSYDFEPVWEELRAVAYRKAYGC